MMCDWLVFGLSHPQQFTALKQSRDSEEQSSLQHHGQAEELQALQDKVRWMTSCQSACASNEIRWSSLAGNAFFRDVTFREFCRTTFTYTTAFHSSGNWLAVIYSWLHPYHPLHTHTRSHCMLFSLSTQPWSNKE